MNYKKIIPNKNLRLKILELTNFIPDEMMIKLQYRIKTGRSLNLETPERYTEKLQWYKLHYRDSLMTICSDKFRVREYVKDKGLESILNPLYATYTNVNEIDYASLPMSFAIKHTNGSGANIFVNDKEKINFDALKDRLSSWMKRKVVNYGREWSYYEVESRIVVEKLLERDENNDLPDYKFFCFDGKVKYLYTMIDYVDDHSQGKCSFFTPDFEKLHYRRSEYAPIDRQIKKPKNFDKMIKIAERLSEDFPHVRVDLYNIKGEIVFGELTFYNAGGYSVFSPDEFDFIMGKEFKLPLNQMEKS
ncbi:ATP-grasp fold amidoligase family protein [Desemzia sp. FAM 23991]|uniref:ATP-grasp fold amidoligase family protein n=1 Tax=unclassified Desemzia TaxID=2685243 RepID=UPI00388AEE4D